MGIAVVIAIAILISQPQIAHAFCGFYVAKADTNLYNQASQVAIARDGQHTVLTMGNDYQGAVKDFALVVPIPTAISQDQVTVSGQQVLDRLDAVSAPRLVEYIDRSHPCDGPPIAASPEPPQFETYTAEDLGVTVEEQFSVGEYNILILSARESDGLEVWLQQNQYQLPNGASQVLAPYIRQGMKFFVARVNLEEFDRSGYQTLRPLQISYDSPKFMLPIRLGMLNADGPQDLVVYLISPEGRAELTNYRTVDIPTDIELPLFVQNEFGQVYTDIFQHSYEQENKRAAFLEYAWDMSSCDPCSADPLNSDELAASGVTWLDRVYDSQRPRSERPIVFLTRLHVRYERDTFPEDLFFQTTNNRTFFQGRYITHKRHTGNVDCHVEYYDRLAYYYQGFVESGGMTSEEARKRVEQELYHFDRDAQAYLQEMVRGFKRESRNLAHITGQDIQTIRQRISDEVPQPQPSPWLILYPKSS